MAKAMIVFEDVVPSAETGHHPVSVYLAGGIGDDCQDEPSEAEQAALVFFTLMQDIMASDVVPDKE